MPPMTPGLPSWVGLSRSNSFEVGADDGGAEKQSGTTPRGSADQVMPMLQGVQHGAGGAEPVFGAEAGAGFAELGAMAF